jgi:hypothetical protein
MTALFIVTMQWFEDLLPLASKRRNLYGERFQSVSHAVMPESRNTPARDRL